MTAGIFVTGMGIIAPVGTGVPEILDFISTGNKEIRLLDLFPAATILPVGQVRTAIPDDHVPRAHHLAMAAVREALEADEGPVDAIVLGTSTGGMSATEVLLRQQETDPGRYRFHGAGSIAAYIADQIACRGPVITVSTACSSGTAALGIALALIRSGRARRVLAAAADSLCRFTYYGFHSLQLIDPDGAKPFDQNRCGMNVSEGAAALVLEESEEAPPNACAQILGAGLSCDAHHPTAPHPEGQGALLAMQRAMTDASVHHSQIDYINLHGTGTMDNDQSEARAVKRIFNENMPPMSSIKGAMGHPLAAAGIMEAVISILCIQNGRIPPNTGCLTPDPQLGIQPVLQPVKQPIRTVLSNSFGFGGNNASVVIGASGTGRAGRAASIAAPLAVIGYECVTGAGKTQTTLDRFLNGKTATGILALDALSENLPPRLVRRLKRLPRMALALTDALKAGTDTMPTPASIFWGTGWGAVSETHDFLTKLFESDEKFTSPTDFIGSVHNAPAGQMAMYLKATGANITATGGDYSFEQALLSAELLVSGNPDKTAMVIGADEHHPSLSGLFDTSVSITQEPSDGGGAILVKRADDAGKELCITLRFYENAGNHPDIIGALINSLGGPAAITPAYGAVLVGIPAAHQKTGQAQLDEFRSRTGFVNPVIDYRKYTGEHASASAVASVLAAHLIRMGRIPAPLAGREDLDLAGRKILILGTGPFITAIELYRS